MSKQRRSAMSNQPVIEFKKTDAKRYAVYLNSQWVGYFERRYHNPGRSGCGYAYYYYLGSVKMDGKFIEVNGSDVKTVRAKTTFILTQDSLIRQSPSYAL
jgi:hypothetical protein